VRQALLHCNNDTYAAADYLIHGDQIDDASSTNSYIPTISDREKQIYNAINNLTSSINSSQVLKCIETLLALISNALRNPGDPKYKKIRKANARISRDVAQYPACVQVLKSVGFQDNENEEFWILTRDDPGLLWLGQSSLENHKSLLLGKH